MDDFERRIPDIVDPKPESVGGPPKVEDVHNVTPDPALKPKPHLEPADVTPDGQIVPDPVDFEPERPALGEDVTYMRDVTRAGETIVKPAEIDPVRPVHRDDARYERPQGEARRRGPNADEIRNYRVGSERPDLPYRETKYNQPRSQLDPAHQSPNLRMGIAIASLVLGLLGFALFWIPYFGFVTPVLAILFGAVGLVQSQSQPEYFGGRGFAIAGIVLGLICLGLAFLSLSVLSCTVDWMRDAFQLR